MRRGCYLVTTLTWLITEVFALLCCLTSMDSWWSEASGAGGANQLTYVVIRGDGRLMEGRSG